MSSVQHFGQNIFSDGRDFVVGDIHGCFTMLSKKLKKIKFNPDVDRLFSVGDLVDRGPESEQALDWLAKPWFHAVRGNHEQMAIDYVDGYGDSYYSYNGGQWMIDLPKEHGKLFAEAFKKLPIAIDVEISTKNGQALAGIIHAECPVKYWGDLDLALNSHNKDSFENVAMWSRDKIQRKDDSNVEGVEILYVGHTPLKDVMLLGNVAYIDTAACFKGGRITLVQIGKKPRKMAKKRVIDTQTK